jgi:opacity protein-like surface antigen
MADFGLAYRLYEEQFENSQKLTFEPYGGLRYGYLRQKIDLNVTIAGVGSVGAKLGDSEDWVEPFIGGRIRWDLNDKWAIDFRGDAGGFGIGSASDLLWQVALGIDYKMSEKTSLVAGYRYLELDYSRGSGSSEFGIDMEAQGPYLGLSILF